jgi:anti-sigma factor RsiW
MNTPACGHLDDYPADALTPDERQAFVDHLADCAACRQQVDEAERLNRLVAEAVAVGNSVPPGLVGRIERRLRARRRRMMVWAGAAAAAVLAAGGVTVWLTRPPAPPVEQAVTPRPTEKPPAQVTAAPPRVEVTVTSPEKTVARPVKTRNPAVTVVWIYPSR